MNRDPYTDTPSNPGSTNPPVQTAPTRAAHTIGSRGEQIAADYLAAHGFQILARNWHSAYGELDLVAREGDALVAVEVKTRSGTGYGDPLAAITARKAGRLRRLLYEWARTHSGRATRLRVDAVGITLLPGARPQLDHLRGIS